MALFLPLRSYAVKRVKLIKYLEAQGCVFTREGGNHTVYHNPQTNRVSAIPRHNEIPDPLAKKICKDLGIPPVK